MKKIGIITYFYYYNYGTMLQGYALHKALEKIGDSKYHVEIIDCRFGEKEFTKWEVLKIRIKRLLVYLREFERIRKQTYYKHEFLLRKPAFDDFAKSECCLSRNMYPTTLDLINNPPSYDIYFTGSDQTWSPKIGFRDSLFLTFAKPGAVRAAYAPSIGVTSFSDIECTYVKERLQHYHFVSCRERYGAEILQHLSPIEVTTVVDPTLLLTAEEWRQITVRPKCAGKYILCYFLGHRTYYRAFAKQLSKQLGLPLVFLPVSYVDFSQDKSLQWEAGPKEFLGLIDNAEVILTDSFHGSIFSINFNKNFYSFVKHTGLRAMDNMRIFDILERMDLIDRFISEYNDGIIDYQPIDYSHTNELLTVERKVSKEYLMTILNSVK